MNHRMLVLVLLAGIEVLAGIGLRNEDLAARARAEHAHRKTLLTEARLREHHALLACWLSPDAVIHRLYLQDRMAAARRQLEL